MISNDSEYIIHVQGGDRNQVHISDYDVQVVISQPLEDYTVLKDSHIVQVEGDSRNIVEVTEEVPQIIIEYPTAKESSEVVVNTIVVEGQVNNTVQVSDTEVSVTLVEPEIEVVTVGLQGIQGVDGISVQGSPGNRGPKGDTGSPFEFDDFSPAQLDSLKGGAADLITEEDIAVDLNGNHNIGYLTQGLVIPSGTTFEDLFKAMFTNTPLPLIVLAEQQAIEAAAAAVEAQALADVLLEIVGYITAITEDLSEVTSIADVYSGASPYITFIELILQDADLIQEAALTTGTSTEVGLLMAEVYQHSLTSADYLLEVQDIEAAGIQEAVDLQYQIDLVYSYRDTILGYKDSALTILESYPEVQGYCDAIEVNLQDVIAYIVEVEAVATSILAAEIAVLALAEKLESELYLTQVQNYQSDAIQAQEDLEAATAAIAATNANISALLNFYINVYVGNMTEWVLSYADVQPHLDEALVLQTAAETVLAASLLSTTPQQASDYEVEMEDLKDLVIIENFASSVIVTAAEEAAEAAELALINAEISTSQGYINTISTLLSSIQIIGSAYIDAFQYIALSNTASSSADGLFTTLQSAASSSLAVGYTSEVLDQLNLIEGYLTASEQIESDAIAAAEAEELAEQLQADINVIIAVIQGYSDSIDEYVNLTSSLAESIPEIQANLDLMLPIQTSAGNVLSNAESSITLEEVEGYEADMIILVGSASDEYTIVLDIEAAHLAAVAAADQLQEDIEELIGSIQGYSDSIDSFVNQIDGITESEPGVQAHLDTVLLLQIDSLAILSNALSSETIVDLEGYESAIIILDTSASDEYVLTLTTLQEIQDATDLLAEQIAADEAAAALLAAQIAEALAGELLIALGYINDITPIIASIQTIVDTYVGATEFLDDANTSSDVADSNYTIAQSSVNATDASVYTLEILAQLTLIQGYLTLAQEYELAEIQAAQDIVDEEEAAEVAYIAQKVGWINAIQVAITADVAQILHLYDIDDSLYNHIPTLDAHLATAEQALTDIDALIDTIDAQEVVTTSDIDTWHDEALVLEEASTTNKGDAFAWFLAAVQNRGTAYFNATNTRNSRIGSINNYWAGTPLQAEVTLLATSLSTASSINDSIQAATDVDLAAGYFADLIQVYSSTSALATTALTYHREGLISLIDTDIIPTITSNITTITGLSGTYTGMEGFLSTSVDSLSAVQEYIVVITAVMYYQGIYQLPLNAYNSSLGELALSNTSLTDAQAEADTQDLAAAEEAEAELAAQLLELGVLTQSNIGIGYINQIDSMDTEISAMDTEYPNSDVFPYIALTLAAVNSANSTYLLYESAASIEDATTYSESILEQLDLVITYLEEATTAYSIVQSTGNIETILGSLTNSYNAFINYESLSSTLTDTYPAAQQYMDNIDAISDTADTLSTTAQGAELNETAQAYLEEMQVYEQIGLLNYTSIQAVETAALTAIADAAIAAAAAAEEEEAEFAYQLSVIVNYLSQIGSILTAINPTLESFDASGYTESVSAYYDSSVILQTAAISSNSSATAAANAATIFSNITLAGQVLDAFNFNYDAAVSAAEQQAAQAVINASIAISEGYIVDIKDWLAEVTGWGTTYTGMSGFISNITTRLDQANVSYDTMMSITTLTLGQAESYEAAILARRGQAEAQRDLALAEKEIQDAVMDIPVVFWGAYTEESGEDPTAMLTSVMSGTPIEQNPDGTWTAVATYEMSLEGNWNYILFPSSLGGIQSIYDPYGNLYQLLSLNLFTWALYALDVEVDGYNYTMDIYISPEDAMVMAGDTLTIT